MRTEVMDRLEQAMVAADGIPVNVSYSFSMSGLVCERRDGARLTRRQMRTWAQLLVRERGLESSAGAVRCTICDHSEIVLLDDPDTCVTAMVEHVATDHPRDALLSAGDVLKLELNVTSGLAKG